MATDMNMDFGYFTSTGSSVIIPCRSDFDYFEVLNYTQMATTQATGRVVRSAWQRGFANGSALTGTKTNSTSAMNEIIATSGGFTLVDTARQAFSTAVAYSAITNANPAVVSTGTTSGVVAGDTVRIYNPLAYQLSGMDFSIDTIVGATSFNLPYMGSAPGDAAPGAGTWRRIAYDPIYAPRRRFITNITQATSAVVTVSVTHGYVVGQKVLFVVPTVYGMTQMNGLTGEIIAINTTTNTITVNIDSSAFTAYAWPRASVVPFTFAQVVPEGEIPTLSTAATQNKAVLGIQLGSAVCGSASDVMYWRGWKAFRYSTSIPTTS